MIMVPGLKTFPPGQAFIIFQEEKAGLKTPIKILLLPGLKEMVF